MTGPLSDIRILDLTSNFMGPYAALLLADMGADICKVEAPHGDTTRSVGPCRNKGMSAIFLNLNRNKRSIVLDLKRPSGMAALRRMIGGADVLLHSFRPKTMAKLGLSFAEVQEINPRILYCGAFGFGHKGLYGGYAAYDDLIQAGVGMPVIQARKGGEPAYVATAFADRTVGMALANAVTAALYWREKSGRGQEIQVPMFETLAHYVMGDHLYGLTFDPPIGDWGYARMITPDRRPYRTSDGYIGVQVYTDRHWREFFILAGYPEMAADPRFTTIGARTENIAALYDFLARVFETRTTGEWLESMIAADIPAIRMNTPETLLTDPHMQSVGFFQMVDHPSEGRLRTIGLPQSWSETPLEQRHHAPRLGEHTRALLAEFGFSPDEIRALIADGGAMEPGADCRQEERGGNGR